MQIFKNFMVAALLALILFQSACKEETPGENGAAVSLTAKLAKQGGMILIPGGTLNMGGDNEQADPNEFPKHKVQVSAFWMDETEVTNAQFAKFVEATGYKTVAERPVIWEELQKSLPPGTPKPPDSLLQPGALVFHKTAQPVPLDDLSRWWRWTIGADWLHPEGPASSIKLKMDYPVVQVAWEDAVEYAKWAGKRLPTEAEWEWAARGGLENAIYPWGNEPLGEGRPKANFWQGMFPYQNEIGDGHEGAAPVKSFLPNGYGLFDLAGNTWEWCADWFDFGFYKSPDACKTDPKGPDRGNNPYMPYQQEKVVRGGSFLCNDDYCSGYRNARRMGSSPDTGLNHTGFRCVKDVK